MSAPISSGASSRTPRSSRKRRHDASSRAMPFFSLHIRNGTSQLRAVATSSQ